MPLPQNDTPWPPIELKLITPQLRAWDAWYSGDPIRLADHYGYLGGGTPGYPVPRGSQYRQGVVGAVARWFWGQPTHNQQLNRLHVPIAADVCQAGADLLYAEPPTITVDAKAKQTQARIEQLCDDTLLGVLAEAAEIGGALGGSYLRVSWDREVVPDKPFLTYVHADAALPEFRYGRLVSVTFWTVVKRSGQQVWRHVEFHDLDTQGNGVIQHALYLGSEANLGSAVPLTDTDATKGLTQPGILDQQSTVSTLTPGLACVYIPNQRPQRRWRNDPVGSSLGRSDLDGVEHEMDALDEVYTSWMRDIRLGKARVFIASSALDNHGPGHGASFDMDREVYAELNLLESRSQQGGGLPIQAEQFKIRYEEHRATAQNFVEAILRTAGYSAQTLGEQDATGRVSNLTATEVQSRERRSYMTRDRKIRLQMPQVVAIIEKLLAVDKAIFETKDIDTSQAVSVTFADSAQESVITLAQTALALKGAEAASTKTLVQLVNPSWGDEQVADEVTLIHSEQSAATVPNPDHGFRPDGQPIDQTGNDPASGIQQ